MSRHHNDTSDIGSTTTGTTGHHHGRDSALGAGTGAAAVGLAHRGKHDSLAEGAFDQDGNKIGSASNIEHSGHKPTTDMYVHEAQKHPESGQNLHSGSATTTHDTTHGATHEKEGLLHKLTKKLSPGHKSSSQQPELHGAATDSFHHGNPTHEHGLKDVGTGSGSGPSTGTRDSAIAGGAGAGVGAAAYGADKYHHGATSTTSPTSQGINTGISDTTYPTSSSTSRAVDPTASGSSHHYGRDAALAGGAAGIGGAGYAAGKYHDGTRDNVDPTSYGAHSGNSATHPTDTITSHSTTDQSRSSTNDTGHHYGRDAAVVGGAAGVGGAAYEADQHHQHRELEKELEKQHKHDEKAIHKDQKHAEKEAKKLRDKESKHHDTHDEHGHREKDNKGGLLSFMSKFLLINFYPHLANIL
jgi:hypothetical protein